jgi:hypothetical protein
VLAGVVDVGAESEGGVGAFGAVLLAVSAALLPGGEEGAFVDRDGVVIEAVAVGPASGVWGTPDHP